MTEEWKKIEGFPRYSVSNLGRVKNNETGYILKPFKIGNKGNQYSAVDFYPKKSVRVHRLVALHFVENPDNKPEVNHKDGDHFNNKASNLEWVTGSENCWHAYNILNKKRLAGAENPHAAKVVRVEDGKIFGSVSEAAKAVGLRSHTGITKSLKNSKRRAGGYHWKYFAEGGAA